MCSSTFGVRVGFSPSGIDFHFGFLGLCWERTGEGYGELSEVREEAESECVV